MAYLNWIRFQIEYRRSKLMGHFRRKEKYRILQLYYDVVKYLQNSNDEEELAIAKYLKNYNYKKGWPVFPYAFADKYYGYPIEVLYDEKIDLFFVLWNKKKLYMKRSMSKDDVVRYMRSIYMEQDEKSPHKYCYNDNDIRDKVVADIGAAEGFFSLDVVERANKVYIIEADEEWLEALKYTFEPYGEKVQFVSKYVSNSNSGNFISLDECFFNKEINFIKADIEGAEMPMLNGADDVLKRISSILICAYHMQKAEQEIQSKLEIYGFSVVANPGYMIFPDAEHAEKPFLRRGVLKCKKR